jgi:branched-chain amino acid transport system permease protein
MTKHAETSNPAQAQGQSSERHRTSRHHWVAFGLIASFVIIAPQFLYPIFVMKLLCFALFAMAFNLMLGFGGLLSFGHAAFFGGAAYAAGHAAKVWGWPPELALIFAVAVAIVLGAVFGFLAIKSRGIYFAMITLAFAQMAYFYALQSPFTGGEDGLQSIPRNALFGLVDMSDDGVFYWMVATIFFGGIIFIYRVIHSPFGEVLKGIRENEKRMISLGYQVQRYKFITFIISAAVSGLAGGTKALVFHLASLVDVHWTMSGEVVLMTLIGGMGTIFGPIVGAAVIVAMQNYLADLGSLVLIVQGLVFIVCVLAFREGIVGVLAKLLKTRL